MLSSEQVPEEGESTQQPGGCAHGNQWAEPTAFAFKDIWHTAA